MLSEDTQEAGSRQKEPEDADEYKTVVTKSGKVITVELDGVPGERKLPPPEPKQDAEEAFVRPDPYIELKEYEFPPLTLLKRGAAPKGAKGLDRELKETAIKLQQTLQNFGVGVTVTNISRGPAVTRYELQPEQGVKAVSYTHLDVYKRQIASSAFSSASLLRGLLAEVLFDKK